MKRVYLVRLLDDNDSGAEVIAEDVFMAESSGEAMGRFIGLQEYEARPVPPNATKLVVRELTT